MAVSVNTVEIMYEKAIKSDGYLENKPRYSKQESCQRQ